jgi:heme-degrading monooxygenase HmoA
MYARVTQLEIDTIRIDMSAAFEMYKAEVMPELREQPGYLGVVVLTTEEGKGILISLWETPAAADAGGDARWYTEVLEKYVTIFRSPPGRERYEVAFAEMPIGTSH